MEFARKMWHLFLSLVFFSSLCLSKEKISPLALTEETWHLLLEGEWLVKFYAPWCPACKSLAPTWDKVAGWSEDLSIRVADIDVTANPGLSGRFLVTALPTIYHIKDGQFRQYRGPRGENDLLSLIDDKKWKEIDPVAWYLDPNAVHMGALASFFKLSMTIRDVHTMMTTDYGIPVWGSYVIFAIATIIGGLLLGLCIVCCCDLVCPPRPQRAPVRQMPPPGARYMAKEEEDRESDIVEDDRMREGPVKDSDGEGAAEDNETDPEESTATGGDIDRPSSARKRKPKATTD